MSAEQVGTFAYRCALCDGTPRWRLDRIGDAVVTWTCSAHLVLVLADFLPVDRHRDQATITDLANLWPDAALARTPQGEEKDR